MKLLETADNTIGYLDRGGGPPVVVLVHSSGMGAGQWERTIDALGAGHRCLAPDLSGYGKSSPAREDSNGALDQDAEIVASMVELAGEGAHLVGHSYGGAVALLVARTAPNLVSLTLIEPVVADLLRASGSVEAAAELVEVSGGFFAAMEAADEKGALKGFVDYWNADGAWDNLPPEAHAGLVALARKIGMEVRGVAFTATETFALDAVDLPVLVLTGEETRKAPKRMSELMVGALPRATHRVVSGAGHMSPLTHPAEVAAAIASHVKEHTPKQSVAR